MSKDEMKSRLQYLESILPAVTERERGNTVNVSIPAFRVPLSAIIKRDIKNLRMMIAE